MEVRLSEDRERFVRRCVAHGRFATAAETVEAALLLLEGHGPASAMKRAVLVGLEQTLAGRCSPITSDEVKGRAFRGTSPR